MNNVKVPDVTDGLAARARAMRPDRPNTFWILTNSAGHVLGSAYSDAAHILADDAPEGSRMEKVGRDGWDRRAKPCLLGECNHGSAS